MASETFSQWTLSGQNGTDSLVCGQASLSKELGEHEVLVKIHAASLNYRDIVLAKGARGLEISPNIVPGSDGAGIVISVGKAVTSFTPGAKVVTHLVPHTSTTAISTMTEICSGLGQVEHGTLRQYGVLHDTALVRMPENLSFEQAATLTCSGLTAWNALFGDGKTLSKGDSVLTQGTGGVSIAALQFAYAAGATVISTTSSDLKATRLSKLGASYTLNYKSSPNWGVTAKSLSPNGAGITNVVDVGGLSTLSESIKAVSVGGVVTVTGVLSDKAEEEVSVLDCLWHVCSFRGVVLGTRDQFAAMVDFIEEHKIEPVVDERIFEFYEVKEAYAYLESQKHFSKVVIRTV